MVTTVLRSQATALTDPTIKSRTYDYVVKGGLQTTLLRASQVTPPARTVLGTAVWKSPRFNGRIFLA